MAKHGKIVSYDGLNDIFVIHKGFSADEKFKGNIDAGELVLDISTKGRVRGVEIMHATSFFKDFSIPQKVLEKIKDAQFDVSSKPNSIILSLIIKGVEKEFPVKVAVPLEVSS